jgi:hypothetical protein
MSTLRQYTTPEIVEEITGVIVDEKTISSAEAIIDAYCVSKLDWSEPLNFKTIQYSAQFQSDRTEFKGNQLVVEGHEFGTDDLKHTQIELLEDFGGFPAGTMLPIIASEGNIFTFSGEELNGSCHLRIWQLGVFPRLKNSKEYGNHIPKRVREATAWQSISSLTPTIKAENYTAKNYWYVGEDLICEEAKKILNTLL